MLPTIPSGWRNAPSQLNIQDWKTPAGTARIGYRFTRDGLLVEIDGRPVRTEVHAVSPTDVDMTTDGIRRRYRVLRDHRNVWVAAPGGQSDLVQVSRFPEPAASDPPGSLLSPMPGKVVAITATEGSPVSSGEAVVVIEAMKMEHAVRSPVTGTVGSVSVRVGEQVEADQVLAVVTAAAPE